jgi:hypothetical protein
MYVPNAMIDYAKLDHLIRLEKDNKGREKAYELLHKGR